MTPALASLLLEGGGDRDAVEYRIDGDTGEARALVQRYAELGIGCEQLRIDLVEALRRILRLARRGIIGDFLVVDRLVSHGAQCGSRMVASVATP